jgi:hypothetical protein
MSDRPVGPILDGLGVTFDLDEDDLITEVVVVGKVSRMSESGGTSIVIGTNDGMDWISQLGLLEAARQVNLDGITRGE